MKIIIFMKICSASTEKSTYKNWISNIYGKCYVDYALRNMLQKIGQVLIF